MLALAYGEIRGLFSTARTVPRLPHASGEPGFEPRPPNADTEDGRPEVFDRETRRPVHGRRTPRIITAGHLRPSYSFRTKQRANRNGVATTGWQPPWSDSAPRPLYPPGRGRVALTRRRQGWQQSRPLLPGLTLASIYPSPGPPGRPPCPLDHACRPPPGMGRGAPNGSDTAKRV